MTPRGFPEELAPPENAEPSWELHRPVPVRRQALVRTADRALRAGLQAEHLPHASDVGGFVGIRFRAARQPAPRTTVAWASLCEPTLRLADVNRR